MLFSKYQLNNTSYTYNYVDEIQQLTKQTTTEEYVGLHE